MRLLRVRQAVEYSCCLTAGSSGHCPGVAGSRVPVAKRGASAIQSKAGVILLGLSKFYCRLGKAGGSPFWITVNLGTHPALLGMNSLWHFDLESRALQVGSL